MGEGGGGEEKGGFSPSALSLFRFHLAPFPQKRLILRLWLWAPPKKAREKRPGDEVAKRRV